MGARAGALPELPQPIRTKSAPFQSVAPYKPKRGGLAARAMPSGPRTSKKSLQQAKRAWVAPAPRSSSKSIPRAELARINASRKKTRNSLDPNDPCVKRPDSKKAGNVRKSGKGGKSYEFRKWC